MKTLSAKAISREYLDVTMLPTGKRMNEKKSLNKKEYE